MESFVCGVVDNWPEKLRKNRKIFTFGCVLVLFLFDIPMVTNVRLRHKIYCIMLIILLKICPLLSVTKGGVYIFQLMDYYSASGMSMLFLVFFQTISIAWIFGTSRFCDCVEQMSGKRPSWFFYICWLVFGPLVMAVIWTFYPNCGNSKVKVTLSVSGSLFILRCPIHPRHIRR